MAPTLGYWKDLRGLVEPIRLLLAHADQEYEMKGYSFGPEPDFDRSEWLDEKFNLSLDFPNLPYYIDEDDGVKITQSLAILRYLARKNGLVGETDGETIRLEMIEQLAQEMLLSCARVWTTQDDDTFERLKGDLVANLTTKLTQLAQFIGENQFILGDRVSYVDFMLYSFLDYMRLYDPSQFEDENVSPLNDYLTRIESLPGIQKYISSESFTRYPFTGPMARIGASEPSE